MLVVAAASCDLKVTIFGWGYIVPEASHPNVTVDARSGRVLVAEHKDVSFVHQLSIQLRVARGCLTNEPPTATFSIKTGSKQLECSRNEQIPHIFDGLIPKLSSFGSVLPKCIVK